MSFTSLFFLFVILPIGLGIYYISNDRVKEYVLLFLSLLFYAMGSLQYVALFLIAIIVTVLTGRILSCAGIKWVKGILLFVGVCFNVSMLFFYKYWDFLFVNLGSIFRFDYESKSLILPLGISFFTFKAISYLADIYNGKVTLDKSPAHDALYLSFFAQIQSGPLERYGNMKCVIGEDSKKLNPLFSDGVFRFLVGFSKKVLLADMLANVVNEVFSNSFDNYSMSYAWLGSICFSLQLFFDFAGYSDMAIGLSEMFGYKCMENFDYPYMTESVSKFWRRWHISLSQWFRDYIYIPLGGSKKGNVRLYLNLFVVWLATGIWHGASWNFIVWGLGYFVMIAFEKATGLPERFKNKALRGVYRVLSLMFINFQWVFFRAPDLYTGARYIKRMIVYRQNHLADIRTLFLLKNYWAFLVAALILCVPVFPWIEKKLEGKKARVIYSAVQSIMLLVLFFISVSFVVSGQSNPFAYANF